MTGHASTSRARSFASESILSRYEQAADTGGSSGSAMTIRRPMQGSEPGFKTYPACLCCYRRVEKGERYCSGEHEALHRRLRGAR